MAVVSERLSSALGLGEEDGSLEVSQAQLSILAPHLEHQEQEVSAGCLQQAVEQGWTADSARCTVLLPRKPDIRELGMLGPGSAGPGLFVYRLFKFPKNVQQMLFVAPKPKTVHSLGLYRRGVLTLFPVVKVRGWDCGTAAQILQDLGVGFSCRSA